MISVSESELSASANWTLFSTADGLASISIFTTLMASEISSILRICIRCCSSHCSHLSELQESFVLAPSPACLDVPEPMDDPSHVVDPGTEKSGQGSTTVDAHAGTVGERGRQLPVLWTEA